MFPVQSRGSHPEAYALRPLQNNEPTPSTTECPVSTLDAPAPEMHCSKDRTRRLSRASTRDQPPLSATISISPGVNQARQQKIAFLHLAALYCALFGSGWNDGSSGPLIPTFQSHYNIGYLVVSLYFVSSCVGFIIGSGLNIYLDGKIGFGKCVVIGTTLQLTSYIIQAPGPAFPLMAFANFITGFGLSLLNSQANGFVSSLSQNMETKLAFLHASYGLGAFTSPLVATYFSNQRHWSFHYIISACLAACNTVALILVFHLKRIDVLLEESGQASEDNSNPAPSQNTYRQVFSLHAVHFLTLFALIYIGVEVTLGGWIVTFIIRERGGGHSSGYISSGFFGGLTLGRIILLWFNKLIGEHLVIVVYTLIALVLEITIWFVPSTIENALAVSMIGLVMGPMFPVMISHASKVLPRRLITVCIGWITGIGTVGSAALPFLTGLLSSRFGIKSLQPLMISMMSTMLLAWVFVPRTSRRVD